MYKRQPTAPGATAEACGEGDELPEPIAFEDAEEAIETLGRTGRVPDALARRLREREAAWGEGDGESA